MPIDDENVNEHYFESCWKTDPDVAHHLALLSDVLPIVLAAIHDGKVNGQAIVCNKGAISLNHFKHIDSNAMKQADTITPTVCRDDYIDKFDEYLCIAQFVYKEQQVVMTT